MISLRNTNTYKMEIIFMEVHWMDIIELVKYILENKIHKNSFFSYIQ